MIAAAAEHEYARLLGDDERIYQPCKRADEQIALWAPSLADMHAELRREVIRRASVEFVQREEHTEIMLVEVGSDDLGKQLSVVAFRSAYAIVRFGGFALAASRAGGDHADECRGRILQACRLLAGRIAEKVLESKLTTPTVRFWPDYLPGYVRSDYPEDKVGALGDYLHDEAIVRLRAYYWVAPPGPERKKR